MITIPPIVRPNPYFCPKHGKSFAEPGVCDICGITLNKCGPAYVKYICVDCGEIYEAETEWLEENKFTCISCNGHLVNKCGFTKNPTFHVSIDGSWDGVPVGKKIQEKNNQLKDKYAGYSYEQSTVREKVGEMVQKRQQEGW